MIYGLSVYSILFFQHTRLASTYNFINHPKSNTRAQLNCNTQVICSYRGIAYYHITSWNNIEIYDTYYLVQFKIHSSKFMHYTSTFHLEVYGLYDDPYLHHVPMPACARPSKPPFAHARGIKVRY